MNLDYWKWWWFIFQWLLSFYIYSLFKDARYSINQWDNVSQDFRTFRDNIEKFKHKCLERFWEDLNLKLDIMLEWEEKCFEDINILSTWNFPNLDNYIFIQVKTKWGEDTTITKNDWVLKAIMNFLNNINFQKSKKENNFLFIIFTNTKLAKTVEAISSHHVDFYISIINEIITDNRKRKATKNSNYPSTLLNIVWNNAQLTEKLILDLLYNDFKNIDCAPYSSIYSKKYIEKVYNLTKDLNIIVSNLLIVKSIKFDILESELMRIYWNDFWNLQYYFQKLAIDKNKITNTHADFENYKKYLFTFFSPKEWWKLIEELGFIEKWKFVNIN